jgi:hypothetical protein
MLQGATIFWKYDNPSPNKITERGETFDLSKRLSPRQPLFGDAFSALHVEPQFHSQALKGYGR